MPKLPECELCLLYAHSPYLVCALHPTGVAEDSCLDYRPDPNAEVEELWEPEGGSYYNGKLIVPPRQRRTREEQLWLLDHHPMFTGICPQCGYEWERGNYPASQWECPESLPITHYQSLPESFRSRTDVTYVEKTLKYRQVLPTCRFDRQIP